MSDEKKKPSMKDGISKNLKDKGSRNLLMIAGGVAVLGVGYTFFSAQEEPPAINPIAVSQMARVSSPDEKSNNTPSNELINNIRASDQARIEQSKGKIDSVLVTPLPETGDRKTLETKAPEIERPNTPAVEAPPPQPNKEAIERPVVQAPRPVQSQLTPQQIQQARVEAQAEQERADAAYRAKFDYVNKAMVASLETNNYPEIIVTQTPAYVKPESASRPVVTDIPSDTDASESEAVKDGLKMPLAGTILYAKTVNRAISTVGGPVILEILEGELTGSTLIGTFSAKEPGLYIQVNRITVKKLRDGRVINKSYPINAVIVDTKYLGTAVATDIDNHLWENLAFGFVDKFASGYAEILRQSGGVTIIDENGNERIYNPTLTTKEKLYSASGDGLSETGKTLRKLYGDKPPTITLDADTPVGVLFLDGDK